MFKLQEVLSNPEVIRGTRWFRYAGGAELRATEEALKNKDFMFIGGQLRHVALSALNVRNGIRTLTLLSDVKPNIEELFNDDTLQNCTFMIYGA